ncbi:MAG: aminotransferase class I/II-fold pyridoxal phosphate-dependent enzyme [Candidatus Diapherotrites archaeon]
MARPDAFLGEEVARLKKENLAWTLRELQSASQPHARVDGKEVLMMCTNNYLNLSTHPKVVNAMIEATKKWGAGAGAVPVLSGNTSLQKEFETKFAKFKGVEASLLCQTGFAVNSGLIPQLVGKGDLVISDQLNHGSIIDGVRLSKAERGIYKHRDTEDLDKVLREARTKEYKTILIITDTVFSMDGDIAPLPEIAKLAEEYNAMVMVDDCHGEGMLGKGRGGVAHFNLQGKIQVEGGSLGKGFGVIGGTIAGSRDLIEFAYNKSRTWLLSTAHSPGVIAACIASIEVVEKEPQHVKKLWDNTNYFKKELDSLGFNTGNSQTPIIPIITGDPGSAQEFGKILMDEESIFVTPIVFPMVAKELSRLRIQMNAQMTRDDLTRALGAMEKIGNKLKII